MKLLCLLIIVGLVSSTEAFISYDCKHKDVNVTKLSLVDVPECHQKKENLRTEYAQFQLVQPRKILPLSYQSCFVGYTQKVYTCGMHSHSSVVGALTKTGIINLSRAECYDMIRAKSYMTFTGIKIQLSESGPTTMQTVHETGSTTLGGTCKAGHVAVDGNEFEGVLIREYEISILSGKASYFHKDRHVVTDTGVSCIPQSADCLHTTIGNVHFSGIPQAMCSENSYAALWEGRGSVIRSEDNLTMTYTASQGDKAFALRITGQISTCGHTYYETESPELFIEVLSAVGYGQDLADDADITVNIMSYVNSKFVYVTKIVENNMEELHDMVQTQICDTARETIQNRLGMARNSPEVFANLYNDMDPGTTAIVAGEVAYIIHCVPVQVVYRKPDFCTKELPVAYGDKPLYMTPVNHLLIDVPTVVECLPAMAPSYFLMGTWKSSLLELVDTAAPDMYDLPSIDSTWSFKAPKRLFESGIYSNERMQQFADRLVLPAELTGGTSTLIGAFQGRFPYRGPGRGRNIFTVSDFNDMTKSIGDKVWSSFMTFGTVCAAIGGIFTIVSLIGMLVRIFFDGSTLKKIYGWSFRLFAALVPGLSAYLINRGILEPRDRGSDKEYHSEILRNLDIHDKILLMRELNLLYHQVRDSEEPAAGAPLISGENYYEGVPPKSGDPGQSFYKKVPV
jgi:hypothetical protein